MNRWYLFPILLTAALICLPDSSFCQPNIEVQPTEFNFEFMDDQPVQEDEFTISNTGDANLRWIAEIEILNEPERRIPLRDDPGDLLGLFRGRNAAERYCSPIGWDWDNEIMWVTYADDGLAIGYAHDDNYENFDEVSRLNIGARLDGAWANGILYFPRWASNMLDRFTAQGQNIGAIQMPFQIIGVAADVENGWLFLMSAEDVTIHVYSLEDDGGVGEEIGIIDNHLEFHNNSQSFGIEWVPKHPDGQLWMVAPNTGRVHQIAVDTDNWLCTREVRSFLAFPEQQERPDGSVGHDGHNLWAGGFFEDDIRIYDDGNAEEFWLMMQELEGEVRPGQNQVVGFVFDATGLIGGIYEAEIQIMSNDPDDQIFVVSVRGVITGRADVDVEWPEEAGFPDVMDFNMLFVDVFVGTSYSLPFSILNDGTDDLEIEDIFTEGEPFFVAEDAFVLQPGEDREMELNFRTEVDDLYESTLTIISSDPNEGEFTVLCHAEAINPPVISVDTEMIELSPDSNEFTFEMVIGNDGEAELRWQAEIVSVDTLGFDDPDETEILIEPSRGAIQSAESQVIVLTFRLIEFERNDEAFDLHIRSNDPANPDFIVHILIHWPVAVEDAELIPSSTQLISTYPNPFNNSTTISFAVGAHRDAPLRLGIYGLDGRLVVDLLTGRNAYPPGFHNIVWSADGFPAGSYFVRLEAGAGVVQEKWLRLVK